MRRLAVAARRRGARGVAAAAETARWRALPRDDAVALAEAAWGRAETEAPRNSHSSSSRGFAARTSSSSAAAPSKTTTTIDGVRVTTAYTKEDIDAAIAEMFPTRGGAKKRQPRAPRSTNDDDDDDDDFDASSTVARLRERLKAAKLPSSGRKADLVARLRLAAAERERAASGVSGSGGGRSSFAIVGFDVEARPNFTSGRVNPTSLVQLYARGDGDGDGDGEDGGGEMPGKRVPAGGSCLLAHVLAATKDGDAVLPASLRDALSASSASASSDGHLAPSDRLLYFVGAGVGRDLDDLARDYDLGSDGVRRASFVDVNVVASFFGEPPGLRRVLFLALVPVRPRSRRELHSLRTFSPGVRHSPRAPRF